MLVIFLTVVGNGMIHFIYHPLCVRNWSCKGKILFHKEQRKGFKRFPVSQTRVTRVNIKLLDSYFPSDTQQPGASCSVSSNCLLNFSAATGSKFTEVGNRKSGIWPIWEGAMILLRQKDILTQVKYGNGSRHLYIMTDPHWTCIPATSFPNNDAGLKKIFYGGGAKRNILTPFKIYKFSVIK